ncbi:MAG: hypothetical protein HY586_02970 [Candidatus Omnitrophica bacterium]|nr:hypothetical protein [Candidatus Omnitrophota bacterium]
MKIIQVIQEAVALVRSFCLPKATFHQIEIYGDGIFRVQIEQGLSLLYEKDLPAFKIIANHIDCVVESASTRFSSRSKKGMLTIKNGILANASIPWMAAFLAYRGYKAQLYQDYRKEKKEHLFSIVPNEIHSGKHTWDYMYECLRRIGGSYDDMKALERFIEAQKNNN